MLRAQARAGAPPQPSARHSARAAGASCPGDFTTYICVYEFLNRVTQTLMGWGAVNRIEMAGAHLYPEPDSYLSRGDTVNQAATQYQSVHNAYTQATGRHSTAVRERKSYPWLTQ